ncbi:hypothetical protein [Streptomyces sp. NBC_00470]|uniref:hypothetical protein n=1 Tax=Streptomyces sp. NBC_00470 TaxID=2975753 RepID=UPI0030E45448
MPVLDIEPGQSPEAPGSMSFFRQGQSAATGFQVDTDGVMTSGGQLLPVSVASPQDHGMQAWTHDPYGGSSSALTVNGRIYLVKIAIRRACTVSTIWWSIGTPGAAPTGGQSFVGLYSSAGTRLATTNVDASVAGSGAQSTAITAQSLAADSFVWVAFVFNAGTPPTLVRGSSFESTPNIGLTAATLRSAVNGSGTSLPASITPGSNSTTNSLALFAGLA